MFCKNCGAEIEEGDTFCPKCGRTAKKLAQEKPDVKYASDEIKPKEKQGYGIAKLVFVVLVIAIIIYLILKFL